MGEHKVHVRAINSKVSEVVHGPAGAIVFS